MSTLQGTTGLRDQIGSRLGTIMLGLSVLCAAGLAVLILVPSRHHAHKPTPSISAAHAQPRPVTHAGPVAPVALTTPAPAGTFRDPATHALLRVGTTASGGAPLPANHSLGRVIR
jgi:hypothetical protein